MSASDADDVRLGMPGFADAPASDRFARVREAFHHLLDLDLARRPAELERIASEDPRLAEELGALLERLDETDLLADVERAAPSHLGAFRVLQRIGRGGMGEVFLAERAEGGFEQQVALKRIRDTAFTPELARRFVRERQILARLQHPNIAHLIDGGFDQDGRPWLAMEYVPGTRVTEWCSRHALDVAARVRLFLPICDALAFAHRNLIVHRDLKPANLLVDAEGRPKLLDFGIARLLDADARDLTQTVAAMTPAYAAPEQRNGEAVTTATDVYQLGVVLRELVLADAGGGAGAMRGDLGRILAKATALEPGDRYAGASVFGEDLRDWLERRPLRSGIGSRGERLRKALWQARWPLAMLGVLVLAIGSGGLLALREARVAQEREREARASFDALLSVVGSANPGRYAGREPLAGELLVEAAVRLQRDFAHDPPLLRQALGEIGHGLMNLGRLDEAVPILQAALAAHERDPGAAVTSELGLLKLLVLAQDDPARIVEAVATAQRIAALAAHPGEERGMALDALASAAGGLARLGQFDRANDLFAQADRLDPDGATMDASQRENYWRQRGWVALREMRLDEARRAFVASREALQQTAFSSLRRAELDLLDAETALAAGDAGAADRALRAGASIFEAEYPDSHPERAYLRVQQARIALMKGEDSRALALALAAREVMRGPGGEDRGRLHAERVTSVALARAGRCDSIDTASGDEVVEPVAPRDRVEREWVQKEVARACQQQR